MDGRAGTAGSYRWLNKPPERTTHKVIQGPWIDQVGGPFSFSMDPKTQLAQICERVAGATSLEEGSTGVEVVLRLIHKLQPVSPRTVASETGLPIPLVSAIRRELEKHGWLIRRGGMCLSDDHSWIAEAIWGSPMTQTPAMEIQNQPHLHRTIPPEALEDQAGDIEEDETGNEVEEDSSSPLDYIPLSLSDDGDSGDPFLELLDEIYEERPSADPRWDQSHATMETVLGRAELFLEMGVIQGKRCLFLGDDDLTSLVSLLMVRKSLGEEVLRGCMAVVVEVDLRLVEFLSEMALSEDLPLAVLQADLRDALPKPLTGAFDFFFTDPPYTPDGVGLFLERGAQALDPKGLRRAGLAVPLAPPTLQLATQRHLQRLGFVIDFLDARFNEYLGATMQGGVSGLYGLTLIGGQEPSEQGSENKAKAIYTRDWKAVRGRTHSKRKG